LSEAVGTLSNSTGESTTYTPPAGGLTSSIQVALTAAVVDTTTSKTVVITVIPSATSQIAQDGGSVTPPGGTLWIPDYCPQNQDVLGFPGSLLGGGATLSNSQASLMSLLGQNSAQPVAIAFDKGGNAFVVDGQSSSSAGIWKFPASGNTFGSGSVVVPASSFPGGAQPLFGGAAFGPDGTLWVTDYSTSDYPNLLWGVNPGVISDGGGPTPVASTPTDAGDSLNYAMDVAFDPNGNLWVLNYSGTAGGPSTLVKFKYANGAVTQNPQAVIFDPTGAILNLCTGITFDAKGNLWVACQQSKLVAKIDVSSASGVVPLKTSALLTTSAFASPTSVTFDNLGRLWVMDGLSACGSPNMLMRFDTPNGMTGTVAAAPNAVFNGVPSIGYPAKMQFH
jgi:streptogramin lyase